ncbi:hypothetical protein PBI_SCTP2_315 [Salicola phage SCTP-2]|nr:hypothetical protein PBI_SCTP2_315 [Salicola phage SCTP-2]
MALYPNDIEVGDTIRLHHPCSNNPDDGTEFIVESKNGEKAFNILCTHGSWNGVYDPEMSMISINATGKMMFAYHEIVRRKKK